MDKNKEKIPAGDRTIKWEPEKTARPSMGQGVIAIVLPLFPSGAGVTTRHTQKKERKTFLSSFPQKTKKNPSSPLTIPLGFGASVCGRKKKGISCEAPKCFFFRIHLESSLWSVKKDLGTRRKRIFCWVSTRLDSSSLPSRGAQFLGGMKRRSPVAGSSIALWQDDDKWIKKKIPLVFFWWSISFSSS